MIKRFLSLSTLFFLFFYNCAGQDYPKVALAGDYGDPTLIREGKDYYMTHSAFSNAPGLLIWHSTDLLHWEPVCRALPFVPGNVYAPDLVKYKERYYIYFPASGSNYVIWADKITGPWSEPVDLKVPRIDPGHAVGEDGKRYLFLNDGARFDLTDDGLATAGALRTVYNGWDFPKEWHTEGKWLESPKIVKHGEYFYLTSAEGGTAGPPTSHMVISARSRTINGPWENSPYNPIVHTYSADEPWWSKGHGTIIDDVNGNWWIVYHAYKHGFYTLGRFNLVEPIEWTKDGWFRLAKRPVKRLKNTLANVGLRLSDDFHDHDLNLQWTVWRQHNLEGVKLNGGSLYLSASGDKPGKARRLICTPADTGYSAEVTIETRDDSSGGLLLSYNDVAFAGIVVTASEYQVYDAAGTLTTMPRKTTGAQRLKIENDEENCTFSVSDDGKSWTKLADHIVVSGLQHNRYKGFFALKIALAAIGQGQVKFNDFKYQPLNIQ